MRRAEVPVLGVCLGHQALAYASGGTIERAREVMHGRLSAVHHDARTRFAGIPQDFLAVRYHSLVVGTVPPQLRVTAWTPDGVIMALEHRERPLFGVQFHPESVSTRHGRALLENFRDLTPRRWTAAKPVRTPTPRRTAPPGGSTELRRRRPRDVVRARGRLRRAVRRPRPRDLARQLAQPSAPSRSPAAVSALRVRNPAPFAALPRLGELSVLGPGHRDRRRRRDRRRLRAQAELEEMLLKARPLLEAVGGTLEGAVAAGSPGH